MDHLPIFLTLRDRPVLMVGGGEAAARKVRLLRKAGARIDLVAPRANAELTDLAGQGGVAWHIRSFVPADLDHRVAVFSATGIASLDEAVADGARARGLPVNVVDSPALSDFIMPAIIDRNPVIVAISSGGAAPILAARVRAQIERLLPARLGALAQFSGRFRSAVKARLPHGLSRLRFWEGVFEGAIADDVLAGQPARAHGAMLRALNQGVPSQVNATDGIVYLVGAGPGDPDLLTLRALHLLQSADVIVHDRLIGPQILDYARRDAARVYVGKAAGVPGLGQDEINATLLRHARAGKRVIRLKGGDPFVFGRGGEEMGYLRGHGIVVEIVPGITAALGCAASAGVPLTQRGVASAVTFVTGHGSDGEPDVDWSALSAANHTLVIYMAAGRAGQLAAKLTQHGLKATTPVAIIENGTRPDQQVWTGQLAGLLHGPAPLGADGPALIVVGDVAGQAQNAAAIAVPYAIAG
ncbi:MAG: siroheme synthase CysG [Alphaproteobacteria bacterium]